MDFSPPISRRTFLKTMASGATVTLTVTGLPAWALNPPVGQHLVGPTITESPPAWGPIPGQALWRVDGVPKVTGAKIFARDFKARDFADQDWAQDEHFLYALRCTISNRNVLGYAEQIHAVLNPAGLMPLVIIDRAQLVQKKMALTAAGMSMPFFAEIGKPADYVGQPVAMLIFENFEKYRKAVKLLQFNDGLIAYDRAIIAEKNVPTVKNYLRDDHVKINVTPAVAVIPEVPQKVFDLQYKKLAAAGAEFTGAFYTPAIDAVFMEPEAGLAWYQNTSGVEKLHLVVGTQSPMKDADNSRSIFNPRGLVCDFKLTAIELTACYPGGGFGARNQSYFPLYLAMAAPFSPGPLRWAQSRFEQFQVGLKRADTAFTESLVVDAKGIIQALKAEYDSNIGCEHGLSTAVPTFSAMTSMSCYNIPHAQVKTITRVTRNLLGGSQRGFGATQAFLAIETLLDEAAHTLEIDPFTLRRANLLKQNTPGNTTLIGAPVLQNLQLTEILDALENHPLWLSRIAEQKKYAQKNTLYGVGFALSNQPVGINLVGMFGAVGIERDGTITVQTPYIDMGNGAATSLGLAVATYLGRNATNIRMGVTKLFSDLRLTDDLPKGGVPSTYANGKADFVWKGAKPGGTNASLGAFHQHHVVEQAARVVFLHSILPAANLLWKASTPFTEAQVAWVDGKLTVITNPKKLPALSWSSLITKALDFFKLKGEQQNPRPFGLMAIAHATNCGVFGKAKFALHHAETAVELPLDFISITAQEQVLPAITRTDVVYDIKYQNEFANLYAPAGALVAVTVQKETGVVKVVNVASAMSAGKRHCDAIVSGQAQGGVAMAISNILMEACPYSPRDARIGGAIDGPENGDWNFHKYSIIRAVDMPHQELILIPPPQTEFPPSAHPTARAIGEAVLAPIGPALLNALAMATKVRFRTTPVTPNVILAALK